MPTLAGPATVSTATGAAVGAATGTAASAAKDWQADLVAAIEPTPTVPWYETVGANRAILAIGAAVVAFIVLALVAPPFVRAPHADALDPPRLSLVRTLIAAAVVGAAAAAAPFAWRAIAAAVKRKQAAGVGAAATP